MSGRTQPAVETFKQGYDCAQSVLSVFAEDPGMNGDKSLKLSSPFGAGIACMLETCGAVTGVQIAIRQK